MATDTNTQARWRCNAPLPGSYLQGRGIVAPGQTFSTPTDPDDPYFERAREMWIPLNGAAESLVAQAKKDAEEANKETAKQAAARKQAEEDARLGITRREFKTRDEQGPGTSRTGRFTQGEVPPSDAERARDKAWQKEHEKQLKADAKEGVSEDVRDVVREHIAMASGATAAQPPGVTAADTMSTAPKKPDDTKKK